MRAILLFFVLFCNTCVQAVEKRVLVAGGAGFLGSHLCERLLNEGAQVICLDNLDTGRLVNIEHLKEHQHFSFIQHDVTEYYDPGVHLDEIYNLALPSFSSALSERSRLHNYDEYKRISEFTGAS